jgi:hypothetical protein
VDGQDFIPIDIFVYRVVFDETPKEISGRFALRFSHLIRLKRTLDHFGNGAVLTLSQTMGEIAGFAGADGKLGLSHWRLHFQKLAI